MATALFDIEANGLKPTKVHCVGIQVAEPGSELELYRPHEVDKAVRRLESFDTVVAHNALGYDVPVLRRLCGFKPKRVRDSLVLSRQLFGHIKEAVDFRLIKRTKTRKATRQKLEAERSAEVSRLLEEHDGDADGINDMLPPPLPPDDFIGFPGNMAGRHGIEAWGFRLGLHKGDYAKAMEAQGLDPWANFNEDMLAYMGSDVGILYRLWMSLIRPRLLGHLAPFKLDIEITETFTRLDKREYNKRLIRLPIDVPPAIFKSDMPYRIGDHIADELISVPSSLPESSNPQITQINVRDFPGYCSIAVQREQGDVTRQTISVRDRVWIDKATRIANDKLTDEEFDTTLEALLQNQSKNRQVQLTPIANGVVKHKLVGSKLSAHMIDALRSIVVYGNGPTAGRSVDIEHFMATAMVDLEESGIKVDRPALMALVADLKREKAKLEKSIADQLPPRIEPARWAFHEYRYGPTSEIARKHSRFPIARILFPKNRIHAPQRNLPEGYKREFWGATIPSPEWRKAKNAAKRKGIEFVDTRDFVPPCDETNRPGVYEGDRTPIKRVSVSPGSRAQVARRFLEQGWVPDTYSDAGSPVLDDASLQKAAQHATNPIPVAEDVRMYLLVQKRLGQVETGRQAWLRLMDKDDMIHPHINPCGAVTARATHSNPNISQVPTVVRVKDPTPEDPKRTRLAFGREGEWGADCRRLFTVPNEYKITTESHPKLFVPDKSGELHISADALAAYDPTYYVVVGADLSGIELRMLAHYLTPYDGGKFANELLTKDVHEINRQILQFANREDAKRFLFALLYGAGDEKLGAIFKPTGTLAEKKAAGAMFRARLMAGIVGFESLVASLKKFADAGTIPGLDGRLLPVRSPHAALNTLLQSGGALVSKYWIKEVRTRAEQTMGLKYGYANDYTMLLWSHDEIQNAVRARDAERFAQMLTDAAAATQTILGLGIEIEAKAKIGLNWLETH